MLSLILGLVLGYFGAKYQEVIVSKVKSLVSKK